MVATLVVRDESLDGTDVREWSLDFLTERISVRELIRGRVYQEVQDYNLRKGEVFQGLIQPEETEQTLNGWKMKTARQIDWKRQYELALEAFDQNRVLILVDDRQVTGLEEQIVLGVSTKVTFLRLTLLVGG